jgi:hypothetical protein
VRKKGRGERGERREERGERREWSRTNSLVTTLRVVTPVPSYDAPRRNAFWTLCVPSRRHWNLMSVLRNRSWQIVKRENRRMSWRQMVLGTVAVGLVVAMSRFAWGGEKTPNRPPASDHIVIEGPFKSGRFGPSQLKLDGFSEQCPVTFNVCFEEEHGICFVDLQFFLKKDGRRPRDITIVSTVIGKNGKVLGREGYPAFSAHPARPYPAVNGHDSMNWPGREMTFEFDDGTTIPDLKRLEITVR